MELFITGGVKSGKSLFAQCVCKAILPPGGRLVYLATMLPWDGEDRLRVERHRRERVGWGFVTVEESRDLRAAHAGAGDTVLVDSLTALLGNLLFAGERPADPAGWIAGGLADLGRRCDHVIAVSDDLFSDASVYSGETEEFRRLLGGVHLAVARDSQVVLEYAAGLPAVRKGVFPQKEEALGIFRAFPIGEGRN